MKLIETTPKAPISGNFTNAELIRHIENEFPDLSGSLLVLLKRFDDICEQDENPQHKVHVDDEYGEDVVMCPKCGTKFELEDE